MVLWYIALPHLTLADMTAIGFTGPIFIMAGAVLALGEKMIWERWVSATLGFAGVLIVVGPAMTGSGGYYDLVMLASSPLFAISALITKVMTRRDKPEVILVWQCITISLFSFPLAIPVWLWPTTTQWLWFLASGVIGSTGHYCAWISALGSASDATAESQTVKFLDLLWMTTLLGFIVFGDLPTVSTLIGGAVICGATTWVAIREAMQRRELLSRARSMIRVPRRTLRRGPVSAELHLWRSFDGKILARSWRLPFILAARRGTAMVRVVHPGVTASGSPSASSGGGGFPRRDEEATQAADVLSAARSLEALRSKGCRPGPCSVRSLIWACSISGRSSCTSNPRVRAGKEHRHHTGRSGRSNIVVNPISHV